MAKQKVVYPAHCFYGFLNFSVKIQERFHRFLYQNFLEAKAVMPQIVHMLYSHYHKSVQYANNSNFLIRVES